MFFFFLVSTRRYDAHHHSPPLSICMIHGAMSVCLTQSTFCFPMPFPYAMSVVESCPLMKPCVPPFLFCSTSPVRLLVTATPTTGSSARAAAGSAPFSTNSSFSTSRKHRFTFSGAKVRYFFHRGVICRNGNMFFLFDLCKNRTLFHGN